MVTSLETFKARIASRFTAWKIGPLDVWPSRHPRNFHSRPRSQEKFLQVPLCWVPWVPWVPWLNGNGGDLLYHLSPTKKLHEIATYVLLCVTVCHFGMSFLKTHKYSMCRTFAVSNRIVLHNYVYNIYIYVYYGHVYSGHFKSFKTLAFQATPQ